MCRCAVWCYPIREQAHSFPIIYLIRLLLRSGAVIRRRRARPGAPLTRWSALSTDTNTSGWPIDDQPLNLGLFAYDDAIGPGVCRLLA